MRWVHLRLLFGAWLCACFGILLPAHHHDSHAQAEALRAAPGHHHQPHDSRQPHDESHCSICQFSSGLASPAPVALTCLPPQDAGTVAIRPACAGVSLHAPLPFDGRAPPVPA